MSNLFSLSDATANLAETVGASTVRVEARRRLPATGVIWSSDGIIVTANHVVRRDESIHIGLADGTRHEATLVGRDPGSDLALLRVADMTLDAPTWVDSTALKVGHLALALGRPGQNIQATLGVISALGHPWQTVTGETIERYVQTDVLMYPGFSGGPLAVGLEDGVGVAGINTSALTRGASLSLPSETVRRVVTTVLEHGHMPRGYLGVGLQPVQLNTSVQEELGQETGVMLLSVEESGPAGTAGLVQGDIIVSLDNDIIRHADELQAALSANRVGQTVPVKVVRGGTVEEIEVTIGQK